MARRSIWIALLLVAAGCTPHLLLRHFQPAEEDAIRAGGGLPCCFDGAVLYGEAYSYGDVAAKVRAAGKGYVQYFNMLEVPPQALREWRSLPWFGFVADTLAGAWGALLVAPDGDTAWSYAYGGTRYLWDWSKIDSTRAVALVARQKALTIQGAAFWDQYWTSPRSWMMHPRGAQLSDFPPEWKAAWGLNIAAALRIARREFRKNGQRTPWGVIVNGDLTAPPPVYVENASSRPDYSWRAALAIWRAHPWNVLSVYAPSAHVDSAVGEWLATGRVLAFTSISEDPAAVEGAYAGAAAAR